MARPKRLSASSLHVFGLCRKRWVHMNLYFAGGIQNNAAMTGSTCHYALEHYVQDVYIDKKYGPDINKLMEYLREGYTATFASSDYTTREFLDAEMMLQNWFDNPDFDPGNHEVISVENKRYYNFTLPDGSTLPITYIWDREDHIPATSTWCVVDYKSNQANVGREELKKKVQARLYALIAQILHPDAENIRVEFHMLRYGVVVATYTRQDNVDSWNWLMGEIQAILDLDVNDAPATLNKECGFCMMKTTCTELRKNVNNGGVFSMSPEELVDRKVELEQQAKAASQAALEIDNILGPLLASPDAPEYLEGALYRATLDAQSVRSVDNDMFLQLLGATGNADLIDEYTPRGKITMAQFDKLLKDGRLDGMLKVTLKQLVNYVTRDAKIKTEEK